MKTFNIKIRAYGYWAEFNVQALDEAKSLENAIVDKLGKNDIVWDKSEFYSLTRKWLTFEEVKDDEGRAVSCDERVEVLAGSGERRVEILQGDIWLGHHRI